MLDLLQKSLDYIEDNLKSEICVTELAGLSGYSLYHYYHLFQKYLGIPVMQYITRRKLLHAVYEIAGGGLMVDVALSYGFATYAGFSKAFIREFGCSPSKYIQTHKVPKPYRIKLFKEDTLMLTHKKIAEALAHWGLADASITNIYYEGSGMQADHNYYVNDDAVIKFSPDCGLLQKNLALAQSLAASGFSAAVPIPALNGEDILHIDDLYCMLTRRVKGKPMSSRTIYDGDYAASGRYIGEILGQLHRILRDFNDYAVNDADLLTRIRDWAMPKAREILHLSKDICQEYLSNFEEIYDLLPKQLIHRDPNPANIIVDDAEFGLIDFEMSERNVRIYDPCYAATAILSETYSEETRDRWLVIFRNILYGYDSVIHLTVEEKRALPWIVLSNQLICVAYFAGEEKYEHIFKANVEMTRWLIENRSALSID